MIPHEGDTSVILYACVRCTCDWSTFLAEFIANNVYTIEYVFLSVITIGSP